MNEKETALILRPEQALLDVTDKSLYSFNERESMAKFREASTVMALNRFFSLADSEAAQLIVGIAEKVPHLKNTFDSLKGKTELVVKRRQWNASVYERRGGTFRRTDKGRSENHSP